MVHDGEHLSYDLRDIALKYAGGMMWIDVVSVIPWEQVEKLVSSSVSGNSVNVLYSLKLFRLGRLIKLTRASTPAQVCTQQQQTQVGGNPQGGQMCTHHPPLLWHRP